MATAMSNESGLMTHTLALAALIDGQALSSFLSSFDDYYLSRV